MSTVDLVAVGPGVYAALQPDTGWGASNSGLVDHGGGLVVDTFWDLPRTRALIARYAEVRPEPVRRLVNTHNNGDHAWAAPLFADQGADILAPCLCVEGFPREAEHSTLAELADAP